MTSDYIIIEIKRLRFCISVVTTGWLNSCLCPSLCMAACATNAVSCHLPAVSIRCLHECNGHHRL